MLLCELCKWCMLSNGVTYTHVNGAVGCSLRGIVSKPCAYDADLSGRLLAGGLPYAVM